MECSHRTACADLLYTKGIHKGIRSRPAVTYGNAALGATLGATLGAGGVWHATRFGIGAK